MTKKSTERIGYISPEIPEVSFPPYGGERYEALVPDTLDLAERADFLIHALTSAADPEADYEIFIGSCLNLNPPRMQHKEADLDLQPKYQEALPQLRAITGSDLNLDVDQKWAETLLRMQGEDGFVYRPVVGRPWARYGFTRTGFGMGDDGESDQTAGIYTNGMIAGVMALYYEITREALWRDRVQRLIDRMAQLMVYRDDYCFYPVLQVNPGATVTPDMDMLDCRREAGGAFAGWIMQGLCRAFLATGYEPALSLSGKLAVYLKDHAGFFDEEARFLASSHAHMHLRALSGLLEYALIAQELETIEFCRKGYEYAKSCGSPILGYFPSVPGPDWTGAIQHTAVLHAFRRISEGCTAADMVAVATKLSQAGVADYWDDVDRYTRNHFAEIQMLRGDWVDRRIENVPPTPLDASQFEVADRVVERCIGGCLGESSPNDVLGRGVQTCCTANYARALPYVWDNILTFSGDTLKVNLLLNRASAWADVESYIPYEGQVDIKVKRPCELSVRIPEWVTPEETACRVNDQARALTWEGRYAQVGEVKPGDIATLSFPIEERTMKETIGDADYALITRGSTVVLIDPPGRVHPFYQRGHYRQNSVRWVKRQRFVWSRPSLNWSY